MRSLPRQAMAFAKKHPLAAAALLLICAFIEFISYGGDFGLPSFISSVARILLEGTAAMVLLDVCSRDKADVLSRGAAAGKHSGVPPV